MRHAISLHQLLAAMVLLAVTMPPVPLPADGAELPGVNGPRVDLPGLIHELEAANPEINAARHRWRAAQAVVPQVQTLPDPTIQIGYQRMPMTEPFQGAMYGVGQEIPFPGKLRLKGEVAQSDVDRFEQELYATRLRLIASLKEAYFSLHFVHKSIEIVEKNKALLLQFEKTAKARYSVGQAAQQDVFRAQLEISRVLDRLAVLEQEKESLHAAINRLLNRPPADPLGTPEEVRTTILTIPLQELNRRADEFSPVLAAMTKNIHRSEHAVSLAKRQYYPDFDVTALGLRNDKINDNGYQVMVGIKVPLFYASKQRQGVHEAMAGLDSARDDFAATRQDLLFQVKDGFVQAQRAERLITILRDAIIPQATLALQAAQAGYAVGKVDFLTLLNSLLTLQDSQLELHGEMVNHEKALARLEAVTGEPLGGVESERKPGS